MKPYIPVGLSFAFAVLFAGCDLSNVDPGGGIASSTTVSIRVTDNPVQPGGSGTGGGKTGDDPIQDTGDPGSFKGTIQFDGTFAVLAPKIAKGGTKIDPTICAAADAIPDESLLVSGSGGIANVC